MYFRSTIIISPASLPPEARRVVATPTVTVVYYNLFWKEKSLVRDRMWDLGWRIPAGTWIERKQKGQRGSWKKKRPSITKPFKFRRSSRVRVFSTARRTRTRRKESRAQTRAHTHTPTRGRIRSGRCRSTGSDDRGQGLDGNSAWWPSVLIVREGSLD